MKSILKTSYTFKFDMFIILIPKPNRKTALMRVYCVSNGTIKIRYYKLMGDNIDIQFSSIHIFGQFIMRGNVNTHSVSIKVDITYKTLLVCA